MYMRACVATTLALALPLQFRFAAKAMSMQTPAAVMPQEQYMYILY